MSKDLRQERLWAIEKLHLGERPETICATLGRSRPWLQKWARRYATDNTEWNREQSRVPHTQPNRTTREIEEIVKFIRLSLYNRDVFCGAQAIRWEMEDLGVTPMPCLRTINRILARNDLTHRRTGRYISKHRLYPYLVADSPNQVQQADFVGPLYLRGKSQRFYSLNDVDVATGRVGIEPVLSRSGKDVVNAFWGIWWRLGMPSHIQVDNEMVFYGSPAHPRGMGILIRLCLAYGIEPWFIPKKEPWRNGIVEKFNDHYRQKFLGKIEMGGAVELKEQSILFEDRHNCFYRYSKLKGRTPMKTLQDSGFALTFPPTKAPPALPLKKLQEGQYHIVRLHSKRPHPEHL